MTLGGLAIAIGALVDDAVVDVENILRRLKERRARPTRPPVLEVIAAASQEVRSGILYATIIIVLVSFPLRSVRHRRAPVRAARDRLHRLDPRQPCGFDNGDAGAVLLPAPGARPTRGGYFPPAPPQTWQPRRARLGHGEPPLVFAGSVLAVTSAAFAAVLLPRAFLPPFNEGTLTISLQYNPGISLRESNRLGLVAERLLMQVPEVASVGRRTGRAELDEHAEGVHFSEIDVDLKRSQRSKNEIVADIRRRLSVLPASLNVGQPISHRLDHMLSGIRAEIALKIYGDDLDTLRSLAESVRERLATFGASPIFRSRSRTQFRSCGSKLNSRGRRSTA